MPREKKALREICREVGVPHLQVTEVLRRIERACLEENQEVITQEVGTFYRQSRAATTRTLNEVVYQLPAKEVVQLRPRRFQGRPVRLRVNLNSTVAPSSGDFIALVEPDADVPNEATVDGQFTFSIFGGVTVWRVLLFVRVSNVVAGEDPSFTYHYNYRAEVVGTAGPPGGGDDSLQFRFNPDNSLVSEEPIRAGFVVELEDTVHVDGTAENIIAVEFGILARGRSERLGFSTQVAFTG